MPDPLPRQVPAFEESERTPVHGGHLGREFARTVGEIADLVAERAHRPADDDAVLALAGAVIGIAIPAWFSADVDAPPERLLDRVDIGMAPLESGFPF